MGKLARSLSSALLAISCAGEEPDLQNQDAVGSADAVQVSDTDTAPPDLATPADDALQLDTEPSEPDVSEPADVPAADIADTSHAPDADLAELETLAPDADSTDPDADSADTSPPVPALVWLEPPGATGPPGSIVSLAWKSDGASACVARLDGAVVGEGASGTVAVEVKGVRRVVVSCEPAGAGSLAAGSVAPTCVGETTLQGLSGSADNVTDGLGQPVPLGESCLVVEGDAMTAGLDPVFAARITAITGQLFLFHGGDNGLDFVALESVGRLLPDYQNGAYPPNVEGVEMEYLSFPALVSAGGFPVLLHGGRASFPKLEAAGFYSVGSVETFDLLPTTPLVSFDYRKSDLATAPRFVGAPLAGVVGDVTIRDNPALPQTEVDAVVTALGPIGGALLICGNQEQTVCPD